MQKQNGQLLRGIGIGLAAALAGMCLLLVAGAAGNSDEVGQFQICPAGDDSSAVFVLDTVTGHVWLVGRGSTVDLGTPWDRKSVRTTIRPVVE